MITTKLPENGKWAGACVACGAEVTADATEVTVVAGSQPAGAAWERCPHCKVGPVGGVLLTPVEPAGALACEHPRCRETAGVKDYQRTDDDVETDAEGPLSDAEKAEWLDEPIALCPAHAGDRKPA